MEDKIRDEKLQYDFNRETTKILVLPSGKIDKQDYIYEILTLIKVEYQNKLRFLI